MPSFFESLKRMAQGKPVFDANDDNTGWVGRDGKPRPATPQQSAQAAPQSAPQPLTNAQQPAQPQQTPPEPYGGIIKGNYNTYPQVVISRTRTQLNGANQTVYCSVINRSQVPVEVEELHVLGHSRNLGGYLRPGEEREYMVYNGQRFTSEGHKEAYLNYKVDETGDYFQSVYDVEYQFEQGDRTYSVEQLHWRSPIRDIYG